MPNALPMQLGPRDSVAHRMVAKTAEDICREWFDSLMKIPDYAKAWKARWPELEGDWKKLEAKFIRLNKRSMLQEARAALAGALTSPSLTIEQKEVIMEALELDNELSYGRPNGKVVKLTEVLK